MSFRSNMRYMNPYDIHKALINEYILKKPGDTKFLFERDKSRDRTDHDVLKNNHRFLWDDTTPDTWEAQFAKKYYDKLFKEYCIGDLSRYKENKIALRWRIEQEVVTGKGQFICGNKTCASEEDLKTWEVNFAYVEENQKKNALVKIRLCPECSAKLNYHTKKREIKRLKHRHSHHRKHKRKERSEESPSTSVQTIESSEDDTRTVSEEQNEPVNEENPWENHKPIEMKSRDQEMEEYLEDLLL